MKISIIIPIYNVEEYIESCLVSIYSQKVDEDYFEVIAVNDGTLDKSMEIVNEFSKGHNNIRIINKINGGVSSARNLGIESAQGDFFLFVDADDMINKDALRQLFLFLSENSKSEIVVIKSLTEGGKELYKWSDSIISQEPYTGVEVFQKGFYRGSVCGVAFNAVFIRKQQIHFPLGVKNGEDAIFFTYCQALAKRMCFVDIAFYLVVERKKSASRGVHPTIILHNLIESLCYIVNDNIVDCLSDEQRGLIEFLKYRFLYVAIMRSCEANGLRGLRGLFRIINDINILPLEDKAITIKKGKIKLLNKSFSLFYLLTYLKMKK